MGPVAEEAEGPEQEVERPHQLGQAHVRAVVLLILPLTQELVAAAPVVAAALEVVVEAAEAVAEGEAVVDRQALYPHLLYRSLPLLPTKSCYNALGCLMRLVER